MNYVVVDVETSIHCDGNPFSAGGKLCVVGVLDKNGYTCYKIEYDEAPYGDALKTIQERLDAARFVVGFNIKFDLHWLRRYGIICRRPVFDCQLAKFVLSGQTVPYPSLNDCAVEFELPVKLDVVASEYWAHGIDTFNVPWDLLREYNQYDCELTEQVFLRQRELLRESGQMNLFFLQCEDLQILEEMEWNGLKYNFEEAAKRSEEITVQLGQIDAELRAISGVDYINWNSPDHISSFLYGGVVYERYREQTSRILKDGTEKKGERWSERPHEFPRLVVPPKRTETVATKKLSDAELSSINQDRSAVGKRLLVRHWSVAEPVLRGLNAKGKAKKVISLLLTRAELEKLESTYYGGLIDKHRNLEWPANTLHGQFNQCVAATGRLSSSNPNLQNFAGQIKDLFYSRYADHVGT